MKECNMDEVALYHGTHKKNLESIEKEGLTTDRARADWMIPFKEAQLRREGDPKEREYLERAIRKYHDVAEGKMTPKESGLTFYIFATIALEPINWTQDDEPSRDDVVIGIKKGKNLLDCADKFRQKRINHYGEFVSSEDIPPECLCLVPRYIYDPSVEPPKAAQVSLEKWI